MKTLFALLVVVGVLSIPQEAKAIFGRCLPPVVAVPAPAYVVPAQPMMVVPIQQYPASHIGYTLVYRGIFRRPVLVPQYFVRMPQQQPQHPQAPSGQAPPADNRRQLLDVKPH